MWQLNIFTGELTVDVHRRYTGIIATRLYFLFIILSITILIIYTAVEMHTQDIIVFKPSQAKFEDLQSNPLYVSTLECPCRHISIPYDNFISVIPQFHQLCLSDFAAQSFRWMTVVFNPLASLKYAYDDFRIFIVPEFQSLFSLCTLANETLTDALTLFMSNTFASAHVQTRETIEKHANESLVRFRSSTPRTFVRMLDYVRQIAQGNGIVSSILSNWHFLSLNITKRDHSLWSEPRSYDNGHCSCGINATCTSPAFIGEWRVPGFLVGCYPLEALLQSTLECLYDVECIQKLKNMYYRMNMTTRPLDSRRSTPHATVQSLIDELLIDRWETHIIYERYYAACEPLSCSYTTTERANLLYIISTVVGLFGGLSVVFKLITPVIVGIGQHVGMRCRRRIRPRVSVIVIPE